MLRQRWPGLELESIVDIGKDDDGILPVLFRWYRFSEDKPTDLFIEQILAGAHLIL